MIAVEFERSTGRRAVGQRHDGAYAAGASRTLPLSQDEALAAWTARARRHADCDGVALVGPPRTSRTEKWRYWRIALDDGTRVTVLVAPKGPDKAVVSVDHEGVATAAAAARWKRYWRARLAELG